MKKLINGIVEFRRTTQESYREAFGKLATGQSPDALFIACSDSRVVPNLFASTNPGDLFVLRNVGNIIPPCGVGGESASDESEAAAIEFAVLNLKVSDIVICGHSECGAMGAILSGRSQVGPPNLRNWLRHGDQALKTLQSGGSLDARLAAHNQLSQLNVIQQINHIKSYPAVQKRIQEGSFDVHGWWFDIARADVYVYRDDLKRFVLMNEDEAERLLQKLSR